MDVTGSKYEGGLVNAKPEGKGVYRYPNGTLYKGVWEKGVFVEGKYTFEDGLKHSVEVTEDNDSWPYCIGDDRRYWFEHQNGIKPAGASSIRPGAEFLKPGMCDCIDGYYDPEENAVKDYIGDKILRVPSDKEKSEILSTAYREPIPAKNSKK